MVKQKPDYAAMSDEEKDRLAIQDYYEQMTYEAQEHELEQRIKARRSRRKRAWLRFVAWITGRKA